MLFCARDHFGMRPLYYHHQQGRHFLFASDARAILVLPQVPYRINEGRVADFLVPELEWIDYTSTFFEGVYRLPPGHKAIVTPSGLDVAEYWHPQPGPELGRCRTTTTGRASSKSLPKPWRRGFARQQEPLGQCSVGAWIPDR